MKRTKTARLLYVFQNMDQVGTLLKESSGAVYFQYDDAWLTSSHGFPISLSLPLREDRYSGEAVIAVFDNLLPDNSDIRTRLAERTGAEGRDVFSLLKALGRDCVGALRFVADPSLAQDSDRITAELLSESDIAKLLRNLHKSPLGITTDRDFRISVAGAQEKTALLYNNKKWHRPTGATPTTHILKPQIGRHPAGFDLSASVENEHICMVLLEKLGLKVALTDIVDFEDIRALSVARFDRYWEPKNLLRRYPQEDCLQALGLPSSKKYESDGGPGVAQILKFLSGSDHGLNDQLAFLKAQICFWLLAATDGHAKNFSIYLAPGGRFIMTPLYDVMSVEPYFSAKQITKSEMKMAMCFGKNRHYKIDTIARRHFEETAAMADLPKVMVDEVIDEILQVWDSARDETLQSVGNGFAPQIADPIIKGFERRLKLLS